MTGKCTGVEIRHDVLNNNDFHDFQIAKPTPLTKPQQTIVDANAIKLCLLVVAQPFERDCRYIKSSEIHAMNNYRAILSVTAILEYKKAR